MHRVVVTKGLLGSRGGQRGSTLVEFAVSLPFLAILVLSVFAAALNIDRYLVMLQVTRSISHMHLRSVDFSAAGVRDKILAEANSLGITGNAGPGVVYLSRVVLADSGSNDGLPCVSQRIRFGDSSFADSKIAMPTTVCEEGNCEPVSKDGTVVDFQNDPNAVVILPAGLTVTTVRSVYVGEVFHSPSDLQSVFTGYFPIDTLYTRFFY